MLHNIYEIGVFFFYYYYYTFSKTISYLNTVSTYISQIVFSLIKNILVSFNIILIRNYLILHYNTFKLYTL